MAERLPYLGLAVLCLALFLSGLWRRRAKGLTCDRAFASKLAWASLGLAGAIMGSVVPTLWIVVSYTWYGGRVEDNLPPGYSVQLVLTALLVGGVYTAINTVYGYTEHLNS